MPTIKDYITPFKEEYAHIKPIVILAPVQRCGSTLIQRAINAGGEAVIYGENFFLLEKMPMTLGGPFTNLNEKLDITAKASAEFFEGKRGMDATALFPDYDGYLKQLLRSYYEMLNFYSTFSASKGYKSWGLKNQIVDIGGMSNFLTLVPNVKVVCLYRDVISAARSFRARWPKLLATDAQLEAFGKRWADNLEFMRGCRGEKLIIPYEQMTKEPLETAEKLRKFLGVAVSDDEFARKINTNVDPNASVENKLRDAYIPPAEIAERERGLIFKSAEKLSKELGYAA